jgi:transposase
MRGGYVTWWTVAIGVDTHKQWHVAVALDRLGRLIDSLTVAATEAGYQQVVVWAHCLGEPAFGIEGCGSYGAGLARFLVDHGETVFECERPKRGERRGGKNDLVDATLAARRIVAGEGLSVPRGGGLREQLRVLLLERRGANRARTAALNQLDAVIVTAPDESASPSQHRAQDTPGGDGRATATPPRPRHRRAAPDRAPHPTAHRGA